MKKILIVTSIFLPGYKAGGPVKSIKNFVEALGEKYDLSIVTTDRDLGESEGYKGIKKDIVLKKKKYKVIYTTPSNRNVRFYKKSLEDYYDVIYINSLFSKLSILFLLMVNLKFIKANKVIIAPRGELAPSALELKSLKKKVFLSTFKNLKLYKKIYFQATSEEEFNFISKHMEKNFKGIYFLPNITGIVEATNSSIKVENELSIVYISRIHPIKNLNYILEVLKELSDEEKKIRLHIFGPLEDNQYYSQCRKTIDKLPENISVEYKGELPQNKVQETICKYNLFFLPTKGENFGHSIVEALLTGTPVLISDQTPWSDVSRYGAGNAFNLEDKEAFLKYIVKICEIDHNAFVEISKNVNNFVKDKIQDNKIIEGYEEMLSL